MGKASRQANLVERTSLSSLSNKLYMLILIAFIVAMPFLAGLMIGNEVKFNQRINIAFVLTSVIVVFYAISELKNKTLQLDSRLQHIIWILPLSSLFSQINPISSYYANLSTLILVQAAFMFIISFAINKNEKLEKILFWAIHITLSVIIMFGIMNWFNTYSFFGLFGQYQDAIWNSGTGKRLASVFQYPNTYAAFLIAFSLISIFSSTMTKSIKQQFILTLPLVASLVSLLLTESRWGWLSFPVIFILCLPFLTIKKQVQAIVTLIGSGVVTLLVLSPVTNMGLQLQENFSYGKATVAWLILIIVSVLISFLPILFNKLFVKAEATNEVKQSKAVARFIMPVIFIALGVVGALLLFSTSVLTRILPASISDRISTINLNQHSVLERFTFYRDALVIIKDYPILGTGGGGWNALYQMYQNNPYVSSEVHSYYLQLLLEKGLVGFIVTIIVFIAIFVFYISSAIKKQVSLYSFSYFIIATTILFNSALDFHMSFAYTIIILFISLGGMLAASNLHMLIKADEAVKSASTFMKNQWLPIIYVCGALIFGIIAINNLSTFATYNKAYNNLNTVPYAETLEQAETAANKLGHPQLIDYYLQLLIEGYRSSQNGDLLASAKEVAAKYEKIEPYDEFLLNNKFEIAKLEGNTEQYIEQLNHAISLFSWDIRYYELLMNQYAIQLSQATIANDGETISTSTQGIRHVEELIQVKMNHLLTLPPEQLQGRNFSITAPIAAALGQASFSEGDYSSAEHYLSSAYSAGFNYEGSVQAAIYYAALMGKSNQDYSSVFNELVNVTEEGASDRIASQINLLIKLEPIPSK